MVNTHWRCGTSAKISSVSLCPKSSDRSGHRRDSSTADGRKKRQKTLYRIPDSELAQILLSNPHIWEICRWSRVLPAAKIHTAFGIAPDRLARTRQNNHAPGQRMAMPQDRGYDTSWRHMGSYPLLFKRYGYKSHFSASFQDNWECGHDFTSAYK